MLQDRVDELGGDAGVSREREREQALLVVGPQLPAASFFLSRQRQSEPYIGLELEVSRRGKAESEQALRMRTVSNNTEAFGLGAVWEQVLGLLAFGIPNDAFYTSSPARAEGEPAAIGWPWAGLLKNLSRR